MTRDPCVRRMVNGAHVVAATLAIGGFVLACGRTGLLEGTRDDEPAVVNGGSTAGGVSTAGGGFAGAPSAGSGGSLAAAGAPVVRPSESECAPQVIYSITDVTYPVLDVVAHGGFIYWSSSVWNCDEKVGRVMRGQGDGSVPAVELMTGMHCPGALAPSADGLLVAENVGKNTDEQRASVWSVDHFGGVRELRGNGRVTGSVVIDENDIFWVEGASGTEEKSTIFKMARTGGTPKALVSGIELGSTIRHRIALDATHVYWSDGRTSILKIPKTGGKVAVAAATEMYPSQVLATPTGLFWVDQSASGSSFVRLLEWGALQPRVVVASNARVSEVWIDGATVYWSTGGEPHDGSLRRTRVDELTYDELWSGGPRPQAITGDATFVYWVGVVEHALGAVWRACR